MTPAFIGFLKNDIRLQMRNGIYYAYGFVLIFYISVLVFAGEFVPSWVLALFVYTDPAVLGFFFLGALILLEKAEGSRFALAITPLRPLIYFWSKAITLTAVALVAAVILAFAGKTAINWPLYIIATIFTSLTFIGIGFPIALKFKTVTGYLMGAAGILTPVSLPMFLALFDPMAFYVMLVPTAAQFRLFLVSVGAFDASMFEIVVMVLVTTITAVISVGFGIRSLNKEFGNL